MKRIPLNRLTHLHRPSVAESARWTTSLLVVAVGATAAQLTWRMLPAPAQQGIPPVATISSSAPVAKTARLDNVAALHLFGEAVKAAVPPPSQIQAPETHLNFTLRGLFASNAPGDSFAIIADGGRAEHIYRIGDKIGGALIHDILPDRVILDRSGHYEALKLPKQQLNVGTAPMPPGRDGPEGGAMTSPTLSPGEAQQLNELRHSVLSSPQKLFDIATFQPVFIGGRLEGYRIMPRQHAQLFRAAGLAPDDIVTDINGIAVTDPNQLGAISAQLSNASTLQIGIQRPDGSHDQISINLN